MFDDADPLARISAALVLVPHPDDEVTGCGGLLALLAEAGTTVDVVLVSDGAQSHPGSRAWPVEMRRALRHEELCASLRALGLDPRCLHAMGCPDGAVPHPGEDGFAAAVDTVARRIHATRPDVVLAPWRGDAHPDHRATHAIALSALATAGAGGSRTRSRRSPRLLEYPTWDDAMLASLSPTVTTHAVHVARVLARKRAALAAHRSQLGLVIDDDPGGFTLPASRLARCEGSIEHYFEWRAPAPPAPGVFDA